MSEYDDASASAALGALAHRVRLRVFRRLIALGPDGATAAELALGMGLPASTMSFHLAQLESGGLVFSWKVGRSVRYAANLLTIRTLISFLVEDCCQGHPQICGDLGDLMPACGPMERTVPMSKDQIFNVLFLCTRNAARSIMAECILNRLGQGRFRGFSAGSHPAGEIHPLAIRHLKGGNYPTGDLRSKAWDEFAAPGAPQLDFVFTVCDNAAREMCPVWPGQPMSAHWGVPDPAAVEGSEAVRAAAFGEAMRYLHNRVSIFVSLPLNALDRLSLQTRLDAIGRAVPAEENA